MKFARLLAASTALALGVLAAHAASAEDVKKNWTPPSYKIYAQVLSDETMARYPDLLSVTFHGVPPGAKPETWTMYAGSYPERIGNPDDPDDIDVSKKGITILDPRWHRTKDAAPKYVVLEPLRDMSGENIGLIVYAFKIDVPAKGERGLTMKAMDMRDALAAKISSYAALFDKAN